MKYSKILAVILLSSVLSFYSCKDNANSQSEDSIEAPAVLDANNLPTPTPPGAEPAQNAAGVWHFTCAKGCAGGGGAIGPCSVCGGQLAHNTAYHDTGSNPNATTTITPPVTPPSAVEPAQNAAGVWHFTCAKGCAGGAGAIGPCPKCGGELAHNTAYHN